MPGEVGLVFMVFCHTPAVRPRHGKEKGRELNAPRLRHREAPVEKMHQAAPAWARTWAGFLHRKFAVFRRNRSRSHANQIVGLIRYRILVVQFIDGPECKGSRAGLQAGLTGVQLAPPFVSPRRRFLFQIVAVASTGWRNRAAKAFQNGRRLPAGLPERREPESQTDGCCRPPGARSGPSTHTKSRTSDINLPATSPPEKVAGFSLKPVVRWVGAREN